MKIKLVISAILAFLVIIFVSQNTTVVSVTFLAWSLELSLVLLVFIMFWIGMVIGWLLNSYQRFSRTRKRQLAENPSAGASSVRESLASPDPAASKPVTEAEKVKDEQ